MSNIFWYETRMTSNTTPSPLVINASSFYTNPTYGTYHPYFSFTGNNTMGWISKIDPTRTGYISIDYGTSIKSDIMKIRINTQANFSLNQSPKDFTVLGSHNGVSWEKIKTFSITDWILDIDKILPLDKEVEFRHFKIEYTSSNGETGVVRMGQIAFGRILYPFKIILKNTVTNNYYSLTDDALIILPNESIMNLYDYGFDIGKEYQLDKPYTKIIHVTIGGQTSENVEPFSIYDYISETPEVLAYTREKDDNNRLKLALSVEQRDQLAYPITDISLVGVETIDSLTLLSIGNAKIAVSFDSGTTWQAYKDGVWRVIANAHNGMTNLEFNELNSSQINLARNGSNTIRFSYSLVGNAEVDNIKMEVSLQGYEKLANTSDFNVEYDESINRIIYTIKKSGSFSVNYVDSE